MHTAGATGDWGCAIADCAFSNGTTVDGADSR